MFIDISSNLTQSRRRQLLSDASQSDAEGASVARGRRMQSSGPEGAFYQFDAYTDAWSIAYGIRNIQGHGKVAYFK